MKKIITLAFFAILFGVVPAYSQTNSATDTWKSLTEAAIEEVDADVQMSLLRKALRLAESPEEKFNGNLNISYIRYRQGIFGAAIYYADEALKIADADIPNDPNIRSKAVHQKFKAMKKVGCEDEAWQLLSDDVKRGSAKNDDIWSPNNNGPKHRITGFACPNFIGEMARKSITSFDTSGNDVGCGYGIISDQLNAVSVFFALAGDVTDLDAVTHADQAMLKRLPDAKKIAFRKNANFSTGLSKDNSRSVYYTLLVTGTPQTGENYTGAWSQVIGKWELSARVTWDTDLGIKFGAEKVEAAFNQMTENVQK